MNRFVFFIIAILISTSFSSGYDLPHSNLFSLGDSYKKIIRSLNDNDINYSQSKGGSLDFKLNGDQCSLVFDSSNKLNKFSQTHVLSDQELRESFVQTLLNEYRMKYGPEKRTSDGDYIWQTSSITINIFVSQDENGADYDIYYSFSLH